MYRNLLEQLKEWKNKKEKLPLILRGARQVGKTWLLKEFGKTCYDDVLYINFEKTKNICELFYGSIEPVRIIDALGALNGKKIIPKKMLIIFDEIQECSRALTSLKYFAEEAPEYDICCAGSLLGVGIHEGTSFPVGKVEFLTLAPLSFKEYLIANKEEALLLHIEKSNSSLDLFEEKLTDYLKQYFIIGGMPAAVKEWIDTKDFSKVEEKQNFILSSYMNDFSKHAPVSYVPKINHIWESIPSQLSKENKKFVYGLVREGARAREYEAAILWLLNSGLLRKVGRITKSGLPLSAYQDIKAFKLYHLDIGLLRSMSGLSPQVLVQGSKLFEEFKGAITEQYVLQELANVVENREIFYWSSEGIAEIDFVFSEKLDIVPVEVKAGKSLKSQSLKVYRQKYMPKTAIRFSMDKFKNDNGLFNIPLYAIWNLKKII